MGAYANQTNADNTSYPYLFQEITVPYNVTLPSEHSNLAKFPLFTLQALLPYTPLTHLIANALLLFAMFAGLYVLVNKIFGNRVAMNYLIVLFGTLILSPNLLYWLSGNTSRNIEYPALLFFIWAALGFIGNMREKKMYILSSVLVAVAAAGDSLILYLCIACAVGIVAYQWMIDRLPKNSHALFKLIAYMLFPVLCAILLRSLTSAVGIDLYKDSSFELKIIPYENIASTISIVVNDFINLMNANVFGHAIDMSIGAKMMSFTLIVAGIASSVYFASRRVRTRSDAFLLICILISLVVVGLYVFSGLAATSSGSVLTSSGAIRYLTFIPIVYALIVARLIPSAGLLRRKLLIVVSIMTLIAAPSVFQEYRGFVGAQRAQHILIHRIANYLYDKEVATVASGYWYSSTTKLYSSKPIQAASVYCNSRGPLFNVADSQYTPNDNQPSALIISRKGMDSIYWAACTDQMLASHYGEPVEKTNFELGPDAVEVWIFDYNILHRVLQ